MRVFLGLLLTGVEKCGYINFDVNIDITYCRCDGGVLW